MKRTSVAHLNCSIAQTLEIVGEWWTLLILRNIMLGQRRFEAIQSNLGIARNILSNRLNTLISEGILVRVQYQSGPERFEYRLTQRGQELFPVIVALMNWGDTWAAPEGAPLVLKHDCGELAAPTLVCSGCGRPITLANIRAKAGPGFDRIPSSTLHDKTESTNVRP